MKRIGSFLLAGLFCSLFSLSAPLIVHDRLAQAQGFPHSSVQGCLDTFTCYCLDLPCEVLDFPEFECCCWVCA